MLMKKFLLSLAVLALGANVMNAESYTLFPGSGLTWEKVNKDYTCNLTVDGKNFTIKVVYGTGTDLVEPSEDMIKVYKGSSITVESSDVTFKQVEITGSASKYAGSQTCTTGWTETVKDLVNTYVNNAGGNSFTMDGKNNQFRVTKLVVSTEVGEAAPEPEAIEVANVEQTIAQATDTKVTVAYPMTVAFVNYSNIYACDAAGKFIQVYGDNTYKVNDVIPAGWDATYKLFNKVTPELMPIGNLPAATEQKTFTPKEVAASDITTALVNNVVLIKNVVIDAATPGADVTDNNAKNFTGKVGETTISLRNNYKLESVPAGTYDVTVVVTVYNNAPSLYVTNFATAGGSGVAEIEAAEGEAVYYNLQGVKVANPENGIYIRVQGGKSSKVLVK